MFLISKSIGDVSDGKEGRFFLFSEVGSLWSWAGTKLARVKVQGGEDAVIVKAVC